MVKKIDQETLVPTSDLFIIYYGESSKSIFVLQQIKQKIKP